MDDSTQSIDDAALRAQVLSGRSSGRGSAGSAEERSDAHTQTDDSPRERVDRPRESERTAPGSASASLSGLLSHIMSHVDPLPRIDVPPRPRSTDPLIAAWLGAAATDAQAYAGSSRVLDARSSLESSSDGFGTALHWAVSRDQLKVTDFLLQLGVDVNARTSRGGFTALHIAAHFGHHEVAAMLLGAGATPSARSQSGTTPLHHAVVSSDVRTASQLLAHGASVATPSDASRPKATHPPAVAARVSATATGVPKQKAAREVLVLLEKEEKMLSAWTRAARRRLYDEVDRLLSCRARWTHASPTMGRAL